MNWLKILILLSLMCMGMPVATAATDDSLSNEAAAAISRGVRPVPLTKPVTPAPPTQSEKINEIIRTLQDPQARDQLIQQLTLLSQAQALPVAKPPPKNQASATLANLSKSISQMHFGAQQLVVAFFESKKAFDQAIVQLENSAERDIYAMIFLKCLVVVVLGCAAFSFSNRFIPKVYRRFARTGKEKFIIKIFNFFILWFLSLLPIALFALVSYFALIFLHVDEQVQWVLLAWISAFVIVKVLGTIYDFVFALIQHFPIFFTLSHSALRFLRNWCRLLTALIVYGYFILQVSLFLGISLDTYEILSKLLGFLIVILLIAFIVRNPLRVVKAIIGRKTRTGDLIDEERVARVDIIFRTTVVTYLLLLYIVWIVRADHFFWVVLKGTVFSLIIIFFAIKIAQWIHRYLSRDFKLSHSFRKRLPGLEERFRRYRSILNMVLRAFIYVIAIMSVFKIWGGEVNWLPDTLKEILIIKIISMVGIGLVAMLFWEISNSLIELSLTKRGEDLTIESGRTHTLLTVARKSILIALSLIAGLMILSEVGVNIGPLLAGAGVLGLAISLGAQKLLQDIITGFFILLENQIAVGDYVTIGEKSGTVEMISIRTIRLRDTAGVVHIIPYSSIITVSNFTKEFSYYLFEVSVAYKENVDQVITVLRQIAVTLRKDPLFKPLILDPLDVLGLDKFADSALIIKVRLKTKPGFQWQVGREFNRRMKQKFDELNIEIPFPHTVIYFGETKEGKAPPAYVNVALSQEEKK